LLFVKDTDESKKDIKEIVNENLKACWHKAIIYTFIFGVLLYYYLK
jgi:hypothetical protein